MRLEKTVLTHTEERRFFYLVGGAQIKIKSKSKAAL